MRLCRTVASDHRRWHDNHERAQPAAARRESIDRSWPMATIANCIASADRTDARGSERTCQSVAEEKPAEMSGVTRAVEFEEQTHGPVELTFRGPRHRSVDPQSSEKRIVRQKKT